MPRKVFQKSARHSCLFQSARSARNIDYPLVGKGCSGCHHAGAEAWPGSANRVHTYIYIAVAQFAFGARTVSVVFFFFSGGSFMVGIDNQTFRQKMCEHSEGMDGIERTETTSAAVSRNPTSVEAGPSHCQTYPYSESCKHCDSSMFYQEHLGAFFRGYLTLTWLSRSSILPGFFLHCIG